MNMKPKLRPMWQRLPIMGGLAGLCGWKALGLPRSILPRDFKSIVNNWDYYERLIHHAVYYELRRAPEEHPMLFARDLSMDSAAMERITQVAF